MQVRYTGENNKGETVVIREADAWSMATFIAMLRKDMEDSSVIYWKIETTRPDPEVVALKKQMKELLNKAFFDGEDFDFAVDLLFDNLDIKLKGKRDA